MMISFLKQISYLEMVKRLKLPFKLKMKHKMLKNQEYVNVDLITHCCRFFAILAANPKFYGRSNFQIS